MFTQVLTAACFALFAQSASAQQDCTRSYSVQIGDTCDSISAAKNVSTFQLATVNTGIINADCSNLMPGENLCLGHTGEDCSTTYVVVENDSCEGINTAFNLNSTILSLNNPQIDEDCSNIYIGEVLCVSSTVQVPPTPSGSIPGKTIPVTATPAKPKPTSTPAPASTSHAAAPPPPKTTTAAQDNHDNGDNEDDEDLPYCDEIDN